MGGRGSGHPCNYCRQKRRGCPREKPECTTCLERGLTCEYPEEKGQKEQGEKAKVSLAERTVDDVVGDDDVGDGDGDTMDVDGEERYETGSTHVEERIIEVLSSRQVRNEGKDVDMDMDTEDYTAPKRTATTTPRKVRTRSAVNRQSALAPKAEDMVEQNKPQAHVLSPSTTSPATSAAAQHANSTTTLSHSNFPLPMAPIIPAAPIMPAPQATMSTKTVLFIDAVLTLTPSLRDEYDALARKVYEACRFHEEGVEWGDTSDQRSSLAALIHEVGTAQMARSKDAVFVIAVSKLSNLLMLYYEFYDQLNACMHSAIGLRRQITAMSAQEAARSEQT